MAKAKRKKIGHRPSLCTPILTRRICAIVRKGNFLAVAARRCGLKDGLVNQWMVKGRDGLQPFANFVTAIEAADAQSEIALVDEGRKTQPITILKKRFSDRWGDAPIELHQSGELKIAYEYERVKEMLQDPHFAAAADALLARVGGNPQ